jgi:hypothetical protein
MALEFLTKYEWVEMERPADIEFSVSRVPDMKKEILVRKRMEV